MKLADEGDEKSQSRRNHIAPSHKMFDKFASPLRHQRREAILTSRGAPLSAAYGYRCYQSKTSSGKIDSCKELESYMKAPSRLLKNDG